MNIKKLVIKGFIVGLAIFFFSATLSLAVGEFIIKHTLPQETYQLARMVGLHFFEDSPIIPFTLQKNVKNFLHIAFTREFTHYVSTNSFGIRGKDFSLEKPDKTYRILFLGDSMTFGWGVEDHQNYPALIEEYLGRKGAIKSEYTKVETINAGFADGITLDTYYLYFKEIGNKFNPDLVIVDLFPYNDLSDLLDHAWEKTDDKGYPTKISSLTQKVEDGYLVGRKKTKWKYEIPLLRNSHLGILFLNALEKGSPETVGKIKKTLHISEEKEPFTVAERLECLYTMIPKYCPSSLWSTFDKAKFIIKGLQELTKEKKEELLVTIMVSPDQAIPLSEKENRLMLLSTIEPQKYFKDFLKEQGIAYLDLLPALSQKKAQNFFYHQDGHLNSLGHKIVAEEIVKYLSYTKPSIFIWKEKDN